jgi:alpha-L-fucosidase
MHNPVITRRDVLKATGCGAAALALGRSLRAADAPVPSYLAEYADLYQEDPHAAAMAWFREARFGLFLHYGLYSMLGGQWKGQQVANRNRPVAEWIQFHARIPVAEYAELAKRFTAKGFDAEDITDMALEAEMKYINITTRHHDSFCLFKTAETEFQSLNTPAERDLIAELAEACRKKGLGLFFYYSHGRDWRHPHAPPAHWAPAARPHYENRQPEYLPDDQIDIQKYVEFMERQITELLTQYGPVAGIWLDGEGDPKKYAKQIGSLEKVVEILKLPRLYRMIRRLQPQCLISYKKGLLADLDLPVSEDFFAPERVSFNLEKTDRMMEICNTLQAHSWGYNKFTKHRKTPDEVFEAIRVARSMGANLLMNTGPLGDGSIHPDEAATLRAVGKRIRTEGWPAG